MARPAPTHRFTEQAAQRFREAIADAGGVEVFAVGRLDNDGRIAEIEVHCRGNRTAVPALLRAPRPGEVVIHNHPSGLLVASEADMHLAGMYGEDGVGMVITDSEVRRDLWVVEPARRVRAPIDQAAVRAFFEEVLPRSLPGWEPRPGQLEMALAVTAALNDGCRERPVVAALEAGTGTGKSLAYLVPAALWARANEARVAVATFTITLQGQLADSDLPLLQRGGIDIHTAVLTGRGHYLCRRRLEEAVAELSEEGGLDGSPLAQEDGDEQDHPERAWEEADPDATTVRALAAWAAEHRRGGRGDLGFPVPEETWDRVRSDHDQTLRARCPHFASCFYYEARREAARAQVVVVNQHLLLADLALKRETAGDGILPRFDRAIIDEAHHLEDAATGLFGQELNARAVRRAVAPLLPQRRRPGALDRIARSYGGSLDATAASRLRAACDDATAAVEALREDVPVGLEALAEELGAETAAVALRLTGPLRDSERWGLHLEPAVRETALRLDAAATQLARVEQALDGLPEGTVLARPQPLLDLRRSARNLADKASLAGAICAANPDQVQWLAAGPPRRGRSSASLATAPIEVGPTLRSRVFEALETTILTSATLSVHDRFDHVLGRLGLGATGEEPAHEDLDLRTASFPSPFDYARQALLALPRDLPTPEDPRYNAWIARFTVQAIKASGGGAFVLCTSYAMVDALHSAARQALGDRLPLLRQGELGRARLLARFRDSTDAVLFATDSFWEGVSVSGRALRLVVIPRLPFRVPSEPVQEARHERLQQQGMDPFRAWALPQAVLRLRQGFGRLIRTRTDRGAVAILDRRVHERWYGRVFLGSLPPARRAIGPARAVLEQLRAFYGTGPDAPATAAATTAGPRADDDADTLSAHAADTLSGHGEGPPVAPLHAEET